MYKPKPVEKDLHCSYVTYFIYLRHGPSALSLLQLPVPCLQLWHWIQGSEWVSLVSAWCEVRYFCWSSEQYTRFCLSFTFSWCWFLSCLFNHRLRPLYISELLRQFLVYPLSVSILLRQFFISVSMLLRQFLISLIQMYILILDLL